MLCLASLAHIAIFWSKGLKDSHSKIQRKMLIVQNLIQGKQKDDWLVRGMCLLQWLVLLLHSNTECQLSSSFQPHIHSTFLSLMIVSCFLFPFRKQNKAKQNKTTCILFITALKNRPAQSAEILVESQSSHPNSTWEWIAPLDTDFPLLWTDSSKWRRRR